MALLVRLVGFVISLVRVGLFSDLISGSSERSACFSDFISELNLKLLLALPTENFLPL